MTTLQIVYIVVAVLAIRFLSGYFFPNKEGFRMNTTTTCPECQDDSDCVNCGFIKGKCDKSDRIGGFGTCKRR